MNFDDPNLGRVAAYPDQSRKPPLGNYVTALSFENDQNCN